MGRDAIDIVGQRFGTFTVRGRAPRLGKSESAWWSIACDCGAERAFNGDLLRRGKARCLQCDRGYLHRRLFDVAEILASNSEFVTECGCQIWTGAVSTKGYGIFQKDGKYTGSHRAAWELRNGPIPDGLWVLHRCDVRPCINPEHLFLGTAVDNTADMIRKGRWVRPPNRWLNREIA